MKKRLDLLVRLVDGSQVYWDAVTTVEPITVEEIDAMMPNSSADKMSVDVRKQMQEMVRAKFQEAADRLFDRALQRIR